MKIISNLFKDSKWLDYLNIKDTKINNDCLYCGSMFYNGIKYKNLERNLCFECFTPLNI